MENVIKELTKDAFKKKYCTWLDKDTFTCCNISWSNNFKNLFNDIIENDDVDFQVEYWKDKNEIKYLLVFEDDTICINEKIQCDYLDSIILQIVSENNN